MQIFQQWNPKNWHTEHFLPTSNFDYWQICSLLSYNSKVDCRFPNLQPDSFQPYLPCECWSSTQTLLLLNHDTLKCKKIPLKENFLKKRSVLHSRWHLRFFLTSAHQTTNQVKYPKQFQTKKNCISCCTEKK